MLSLSRESHAIQVERQISCDKSIYDWPAGKVFDGLSDIHIDKNLDLGDFQANYIDTIPPNWTVISITLCESKEEILISKIRAGQNPFILRLPLNRRNALDDDDEIFGFDQGKSELQDIVDQVNHSTNVELDLSRKGAKTEWWAARSLLDARLKDLLTNIENIWLGGFKGIFSHGRQKLELLARFQQSLRNILNKHLPSRQKPGKRTQSDTMSLDPKILELFVGLGNPSDFNDVDEPLMDLLYFVIDILQFNGERNAYDEIDFDSVRRIYLIHKSCQKKLTSPRLR